MSGLSSFPLNLVYITLLFVPGLLGVDLYLTSSRLIRRFNRLQHLAYSVSLSLLSLGLLYFLTPFYIGYLIPNVPLFPAETHLATFDELANLSLPDLVSLYILHILSAGALGLAGGFINREIINPDEKRDRREPWAYTFDKAALPPETIQVHLCNNGGLDDETAGEKIIEGKWERQTWSEEKRELYLQNPSKVTFTDEDKESEPLGRGIYIHGNSISRIVLTNMDPQTNPEEVESKKTDTSERSKEVGGQSIREELENLQRAIEQKETDKTEQDVTDDE